MHPKENILVNSGSFTNDSSYLFAMRTYTDGQVYLGTLIIADDGVLSIQSSAADFTKSGAADRVDFTVTSPQDPANISEATVSMKEYSEEEDNIIKEGNKLPSEGSIFNLYFQFLALLFNLD